VRERVVGVIALVITESNRRYTAADLTLAEELARRAAVAIENARLYQELKEADRRKDEFLAMLGHELRNPLAPILTALYILRQGTADESTTEWAHNIIQRQVRQMVRMVDDLLDVS